jgi:cation:H+ antiporter
VEIALQLFLMVGGFAVALVASDRAVAYTRALAAALGAPAFIVGVALVSIGTDLPEIANSIAAHAQGEGDVNVGDSVGSTLTQYTLVLGVFPFVASTIPIVREQIALVTLLTGAGLGLAAVFVADGWLSRWDGLALVAAWGAFTIVVVKGLGAQVADDPPAVRHTSRVAQAGAVLLTLGIVGFGATVAVRALVRLAELAGVPEFVLAFFGASIGTSSPEFVVDITALLRGSPGIALGDAVGSSLVDATLSIGAGPLLFPADVTARLAVAGSIYTLFAVACAGAVLSMRRRHDRVSGLVLLGLYGLSYIVLIKLV